MVGRIKKRLRMWLSGLVAAAISGAAGGVLNGLAAVGLKPDVFNFERGVFDLLKLAAAGAVITALMGVAMYLQKSPLPEDAIAGGDTNPPKGPNNG